MKFMNNMMIQMIQEIIKLYNGGKSTVEIGKIFNCFSNYYKKSFKT